MTSFSNSFKALFSLNKENLFEDPAKQEAVQQEQPIKQKLTKELLLNSVKPGGFKLQRKSSGNYDEYYELASLQMFY